MARFLTRRLLLAIPTLLGVLVVAFLLLYVAPGDPVMAMVGERADPETIARLRRELRLEAAAMLLASVVGITLGILSARRPGGIIDRIGLGIAYLGVSFPVFWVGLLLILLFAVTLRVLPPSGFGGWKYLILPALALGMRSIAFLARMTRSAMLDALGSDFVRTARAKGLAERTVVARHALRNALIPVITVLGLDFGSYLTGSILTETVFSWPGLGRYVVNAISRRDLPAIQGSVLFLSAVFVIVNLITDLAYAKADPRVSYR